MNPVATSDAAFRGGACPTPEYTIAYTGNYTTSADASVFDAHARGFAFFGGVPLRGIYDNLWTPPAAR